MSDEAIVAELLHRLAALDVRLALDGDRLTLNAPKGVLTAELRAELGTHKEALKAHLSRRATAVAAAAESTGTAARPQPLKPVPRQAQMPAAHTQQRLWFLRQMDPASASYNIVTCFHMHGALDVPALRRSLDDLVRRHESLRTRFVEIDGTPCCVVEADRAAPLRQLDVSQLPVQEREPAALALLSREADTPFDLADGPLLRLTLVRLAPDRHLFGFVVDHIVCDGVSVGIFFHELRDLYREHTGGPAAQLPALPIQYIDHVQWHREVMAAGALETQLAYWKQQLRGLPPLLNLPADRPRPRVQAHHGARLLHIYRPELGARLKALARTEGVTLYMVLLAAVQVLLHRLSGEVDFAVGTAVAARDRPDLERVIGFFANNVVLRADLDGNPTVRDLLQRVHATALKAYANQQVPFDALVEALAPRRDLDHSPLFQVLFVLHNMMLRTTRLGEAECTVVELPRRSARFDLAVDVFDEPEGLRTYFEFDTDLFDTASVQRWAGHLGHLLEGMATDAGQHVSTLQMQAAEDAGAVLEAWCGPALPTTGSPAHTVHGLVEAQARLTPAAEALSFEGASLTYGELDALATQVAAALRRLGVASGALVGIWMERSLALPVAMLAVLKAGAAYVPLDPAFPRERIDFMMSDASLAAIVTQADLAADLGDGSLPTLMLGDDGRPIGSPAEAVDATRADAPDAPCAENTTSSDLAYVIYTSGSTGRPKGVMIEHGSVVNFLRSMIAEPGIAANDRWVSVTTPSFDIFGLELWGPLAAGGTVVLASRATALDGRALAALMEGQRATVLQATPATWRLLIESGWSGRASLRMICGGEALPRELAEQLLRLGAELWNLYGPTETTIWSTLARITDASQPITIGRPIAETRIAVLESGGQPAPPGVPGELCIGGAGVARGYLKRPELSAEKFVTLTLPDQPPVRYYRTGDLARVRNDGALEFMGRRDHQVKLRGFRIELEEIEAVLARHPGVRGNVVVVREDRPGDQRLVAYVVTEPGGGFDTEAARATLRTRLPEYMVPGGFVTLPAFPLTPNGKIDRRALPVPEAGVGPATASAVDLVQLNTTERRVAAVWCELLGVSRVGRDIGFFDLGGHSLLLVKLQARLQREFGATLPLVEMFQNASVRSQAAWLKAQAATGRDSAAIERVPRGGPMPLSHTQQRLWFLKQLDPANAAYHVFVPVRFEGALDEALVERCLDKLLQRHESLRTRFAALDGAPAAFIEEDLHVPFSRLDLREQAGLEAREAQEARMRQALQSFIATPFDPTRPPLVRALWVRMGPTTVVLCLVVDHIVADGLSMGVLIDELRRLYTALRAGRPDGLAPLPLQYLDLAVWQRQVLEDGGMEEHRTYWRGQLAGLPSLLALPTDRPRPPVQTSRGARLERRLPADLVRDVRAAARRARSTPFMVLLAAFMALLQRHTGSDDIAVGTAVGHRVHPDSAGVVGFFANNIVLRGRLDGQLTVAEHLARVRDVCLSGMAHQEMPFDLLVDDLVQQRATDHSPLFQVLFVLQGWVNPVLELPGARGEVFAVESLTARYDLTLDMFESPDAMSAHCEYNTDLFDAATIDRLMAQYERLLADLVARPEAPLASLQMLDEAALRHQLLALNTTAAPLPAHATVHGLFEAQARREPEAAALRFGVTSISYRELDERAETVARALRARNVGRGDLVGVWLERSIDMVAAVLGTMKAGAAYVPLDPAFPAERLRFMMADAAMPVVLTHTALAAGLEATGPLALCLDGEQDLSGPGRSESATAHSDDAAYVIYTSGSTGRPKGVVVEHRSVVNFLRSMQRTPGLHEGDRFVAVTTLSFDIAGLELLGPLTCGATVVLAPRSAALDGQELAQLLQHSDATHLQATPATWRLLLASGWTGQAGLRMLCGGEAMPRDLAQALTALPGELWNLYGPTETTIWSTVARIDLVDGPPPIGRPIDNTQVYVLDAAGRPVPQGVTGELCIAGAGVARGYLRRDELNAEKFLWLDLPLVGPVRVYRTGDMVRWRNDGQLEFAGRRDHQVKLRGFRIELGEIEAALAALDAVTQAVAVVREDTPGDQRLVAYVVAKAESTFAADAARRALRTRLPEYMVPSHYVPLPRMPLTPNGKIDRKALPAPAVTGAPRETDDDAATLMTPAQQKVAEAWQQVLGLPRVGLRANFFDLGGHSLLLVKLHARLEREFDLSLPLVELFRHTTVQAQAERLTGGTVTLGIHDPEALSRARARAKAIIASQTHG